MKHSLRLFFQLTVIIILITVGSSLSAQQSPIQYFRSYSKKGINVYETTKTDTTSYTGLKVRIGGNFTQDFQGLRDQNNAIPVVVGGVNTNQLATLTSGFNLAMANLNIDAQLQDGIRMNMTMYLSTRHHQDAWIKGGYIQFDKLLFLKSRFIDSLMKNFTIKVGDYEVDYGDQHFRRTDGGNSMYNPFMENYIMDEFATEIGGEIYYHHKSGFLAMIGITDGQLNPTVIASTQIDTGTGQLNRYDPAFHGKIGYDKQVNKNLRFRITGSVYVNKSSPGNTLFFGDRTGSHYFFVMENTAATSDGNAWSGRYNPQFSEQVQTFMVNPFVKYKGLEFFGTYEMAQGRMITEVKMRMATQYAADLIYRFGQQKESFWIGLRYNSVMTTLPLNQTDVTINRVAGSVGWFVTNNIMMKAEYVYQQYKNFANTDIRSGGKFSGYMLEASIGF